MIICQVKFLMGWTAASDEDEEDGADICARELCHPLCQCDQCKPLQRVSYDTVSPAMSVWPLQTTGELRHCVTRYVSVQTTGEFWHCVTYYVSVTDANNVWVMILCHPLCQCDRCKQRVSYDTVSPAMSVWPMQTTGELWHCVTHYVSVTTANNGWVMTLCHPLCQCANNGWVLTLCHVLCQCDRCKQRMSYDTVSPAMSVWPLQTTGEL